MADLLTLQQIAELKEAFAIFDKDGDGSVTSADLAEVFAAVGQRVPHEILNRMLNDADIDANGVVDFPEFLTLYAQRLHDDDSVTSASTIRIPMEDLREALGYLMNRLRCMCTVEVRVAASGLLGPVIDDGRFKEWACAEYKEILRLLYIVRDAIKATLPCPPPPT